MHRKKIIVGVIFIAVLIGRVACVSVILYNSHSNANLGVECWKFGLQVDKTDFNDLAIINSNIGGQLKCFQMEISDNTLNQISNDCRWNKTTYSEQIMKIINAECSSEYKVNIDNNLYYFHSGKPDTKYGVLGIYDSKNKRLYYIDTEYLRVCAEE